MDVTRLRNFLKPLIEGLSSERHVDLDGICEELGLPKSVAAAEATKRERLQTVLESLSDDSVPLVAQRFLELRDLPASVRNQLEDELWSDSSIPEINKRVRREISRALNIENLFHDEGSFDQLLTRLWVIEDELATSLFLGRSSLREELDRHVFRNRGDWSTEDLFSAIGAFEAHTPRFTRFLEGLASAEVQLDEFAQRRIVANVNGPLSASGVELRETAVVDGYPVFSLASTRSISPGRPKNLIFASSVKPDIVFRDAVNNDIEIRTNRDQVLVYDRPVDSAKGLRWCDLQTWWAESRSISDPLEAKKSLYRRLRQCLPESSPPQILVFDQFYSGFGTSIPNLPALLPEVWLHWDPKTVRERGPQALTRFRMDFLMLLPRDVRVVIEVDGQHHYAKSTGMADGRLYGAMMAADRDLRLTGYEVFRFGAAELVGEEGEKRVRNFFELLFKAHCVKIG